MLIDTTKTGRARLGLKRPRAGTSIHPKSLFEGDIIEIDGARHVVHDFANALVRVPDRPIDDDIVSVWVIVTVTGERVLVEDEATIRVVKAA